VSNLTNLLAFHAIDVSFTRFAALIALPWLVALALEWLALRWFFRDELAAPARPALARHAIPLPRLPLAVLAATLAGFTLSSPLDFDPVWPAAAGAAALLGPQLRRGAVGPRAVVRAIDLPLLGFVLGLGVIVRAVSAPASATSSTGCCRAEMGCSRCSPRPPSPPCSPTWSTTCPPC
jgi:arsenical pump membrane protein